MACLQTTFGLKLQYQLFPEFPACPTDLSLETGFGTLLFFCFKRYVLQRWFFLFSSQIIVLQTLTAHTRCPWPHVHGAQSPYPRVLYPQIRPGLSCFCACEGKVSISFSIRRGSSLRKLPHGLCADFKLIYAEMTRMAYLCLFLPS